MFINSMINNNVTYLNYYNRLKELAISSFKWKNMPETIDTRFLELALFENSKAIFFKDEELDGYLALQCTYGGKLDVYRVPIKRKAYAVNGYNKWLTKEDSVIIFNNLIRTNCKPDIEMFALRLYNLDRAIDVNANAQKTPILIECGENQQLTMEQIYQKYEGNQPVIYQNKNFDMNNVRVLKTDAPFVADKLYTLKTEIWNEALTYLGISNININKKERLISDEVTRNMGGVVASRFSRLKARKQACEQINKMFGLNIDVEFEDTNDVIVDGVNGTESEVGQSE